MIEVLVLFLGPSFFSVLIWFGLKKISSPAMKKTVLLALPVLFVLSILLWALFKPHTIGPSPFIFALAAILMIAFAAGCPVALAMNVFPGIFTKKGEGFVAAFAPLISIPFILKLLISPEVWDGKLYGDYFFIKIPLVGWMIDPFTSGWAYTTAGGSLFPMLILYTGFFVEMTIVMLLVFWCFRMAAGSPGDGTTKQED